MTTLVAPLIVTSPASGPEAGSRAVDADELLRLSVEQYHAMAAAGVLSSDDHVELLEGWLVRKMTKSPLHRIVTLLTRTALQAVVPAGWYVDSQEPVTTGDSEPEPDTSVVRGQTTDYLARHPGAADVGLVVEAADSSLRRDRDWKKRIYARAKFPVYWLINLVDRAVEVFTDPTGPTSAADEPDYRLRAVYRAGDRVPLVLDGAVVGEVPVDSLFPA